VNDHLQMILKDYYLNLHYYLQYVQQSKAPNYN